MVPNAPQSRCRRSRRLSLERLELRLNLAFAHLHHFNAPELRIAGTDGDDRIELKLESQAELVIATRNDQVVGSWPLKHWSAIRVEAQDGDDHIHVDPQLPVRIDVDGGNGNDTVFGIHLGPTRQVMFTGGEPVAFNNRVCFDVECVRVADGESADAIASAGGVDGFAIATPGFQDGFDRLSTSLSTTNHDHQSAPGAPSSTTAMPISHSHQQAIAGNRDGGNLHHPSPLEAMATVNSPRNTRLDMGAGNVASTQLKTCFVKSTTIESRIENSRGVLAQEIVPVKPGCQ